MLLAIQMPLWLGKGGWMRVRDSERQLAAQNRENVELAARNAKLAAEVKDLREGAGAVEERARYELGMLKEGELFVQIVEPVATPAENDAKPLLTPGAVPPKPASPQPAAPKAAAPKKGEASRPAR